MQVDKTVTGDRTDHCHGHGPPIDIRHATCYRYSAFFKAKHPEVDFRVQLGVKVRFDHQQGSQFA
jgi:hypothetical protein